MENVIKKAPFIKHATFEGVFMKHFYDRSDNDRLNNLEVNTVPGYGLTSSFS